VPLFPSTAFGDNDVIKNKKAWRFLTMAESIMVFDYDGHIIESIPEQSSDRGLTHAEKVAVLGGNARRFFRL